MKGCDLCSVGWDDECSMDCPSRLPSFPPEVSILIPYRPDGTWRDAVFQVLVNRWSRLLPEAEICLGSDDGQPFNRARARNRAFLGAHGNVLIVADADTTVPDRNTILRAIGAVRRRQGWVLPFSTYYNLTEQDTRTLTRIVDEHPDVKIERPLEWEHKLNDSEAGVLVMPREAWEAVNGYDEGFVGWGYEDRSMAVALNTLYQPCRRLANAYVLHFWHEVAADGAFNSPTIHHNRRRHEQYRAARTSPQAMRGLRG